MAEAEAEAAATAADIDDSTKRKRFFRLKNGKAVPSTLTLT